MFGSIQGSSSGSGSRAPSGSHHPDPGFDPKLGVNPQKEPAKALNAIQLAAQKKREERRQARAKLNPTQQQALAQVEGEKKTTLSVPVATPGSGSSSARPSGFGQRPTTMTVAIPQQANISTVEEVEGYGLEPTTAVAIVHASHQMALDPDATAADVVCEEQYDAYQEHVQTARVPVGIANTFKNLVESENRIVILDDSFSMSARDGATGQMREGGYVQVVEVEMGFSSGSSRTQSRMDELKNRLMEAMPVYLRANTEGTLRLVTMSGAQQPLDLDLSARSGDPEEQYQKNMSLVGTFVQQLQPRLDHTPTLSVTVNELNYANDQGKLNKTRVTIFTDGAINERNPVPLGRLEQSFQQYVRGVVRGRSDFTSFQGNQVPHHVAASWYMDADSNQNDRRFSYLVGASGVSFVIAACTNDERDLGELNEMDAYHSGVHSKMEALDDQKAEASEVAAHNPDFPYNSAVSNIRLWIGADVAALDNLDERRLTTDEMEELLGYSVNDDTYNAATQHCELQYSADQSMTSRRFGQYGASSSGTPAAGLPHSSGSGSGSGRSSMRGLGSAFRRLGM